MIIISKWSVQTAPAQIGRRTFPTNNDVPIGIKGPVSSRAPIIFKKKISKILGSRQPHLWQTGTEILHKLNQVLHGLNNLEFIKLTFPIIINSGGWNIFHEWLLEGGSPQRLPDSRAPSCSRDTAFSPIEHFLCYGVCFCIRICICSVSSRPGRRQSWWAWQWCPGG